MKAKSFFINLGILLGAISLTNCSNESDNVSFEKEIPITINATLSGDETRTGVYLGDDGLYYPEWLEGDRIALYGYVEGETSIGETGINNRYFTATGLSNETSGVHSATSFTGTLSGTTTLNTPITTYAYYPYQSTATLNNDVSKLKLNIPTLQHPKTNSFDPVADILVCAKPETVSFTAKDTDISIAFKRLVSIIKMRFSNLPTGVAGTEKVQKIKLTADNQDLTGDYYVDMKTAAFSGTQPTGAENTVELIYNGTDDELSLSNINSWIIVKKIALATTDTFTIEITTDSHVITKDITNSTLTTTEGKLKKLNVDLSTANVAATTTKYYTKVTTEPSDWSGDYLIVYEAENVAFDGSRTTLDASNNTISVSISDNKIEATATINASKFTIAAVTGGYSVQSASGYYIYKTANANGLDASTTTPGVNTISVSGITASGNCQLKYNANSDQKRFRFYKSGQKAISLYKLED